MNLSQEIHRETYRESQWPQLFDKDDYFRLKVIELKEKRASRRLTDIEHEMVVLEKAMEESGTGPQIIYKSVLDTLNKKFSEIDDQILALENGSLKDEEELIEKIEFNLDALEEKIDVFAHFFNT
ncbi:MAG: hypothetical protein CME63_12440 [Halobacteriovoraceae bacterium]|nr:hypothetical protein [Halobacteriovoraceae bacterium]MBC98551.1 hypothetical protein [Halobacteriovoraceae bacterium]|tara:strand:- start:810 stop:1184 length:375 start_codon:yes stop_codon:yes gene_type:complete